MVEESKVDEIGTTTVEKVVEEDYVLCHCAAYIRTKGINIRGVDAKYYASFSKSTPIVGGVVILKYLVEGEEVYHVSYIEELRQDGLWISETNYRRCKYTERLLRFDDPHIVQFFKP